MKHSITNENPTKIKADAVVVPVFKGQTPPADSPAGIIDKVTGGLISRLMESSEIEGGQAEVTTLLGPAGMQAGQVIVAGLGEVEKLDCRSIYQSIGAAARQLAKKKRSTVACYVDPSWSFEFQETAVVAASVGCVGQDLYRAEKKTHAFNEVQWSGVAKSAIESGTILSESVNLTRHLVNEPAEAIYPESFAERARQVASESELEIEIWDQDRLQQERCRAILAVARGSDRPPRLVILRHNRGGADAPMLGLVGKGVTFDSGGLSLKPSDGMFDMKCDMAGAGTVLGAMQAIGQLHLPINVMGIMGLVENMVSGDSYKLGDVLTARNGKTIEVHNTDAEGRLVLADALSVAVDLGADRLIDLATLTGACLVALGIDVSGLMSNDQDWCDQVIGAANACGEGAWQLPMFAEYGELIKSEVADIKNVGQGRWAGAITAAKLLEEFVGDVPWVHMDIAGPAFHDKPKGWIDAGATGAHVRTLVNVARTFG